MCHVSRNESASPMSRAEGDGSTPSHLGNIIASVNHNFVDYTMHWHQRKDKIMWREEWGGGGRTTCTGLVL